MKLEFWEDRDRLEFQSEVVLNTMPIKPDLLILHLRDKGKLHNDIGEFFKQYNVLEYKSPGDALTITDFYKTAAYASLYWDVYCPSDREFDRKTTLSIVREAYPRELIKDLNARGMAVQKLHPGIYQVEYPVYMAQIIVSGQLKEEHTWLKALTRELKLEQLENLAERSNKAESVEEKHSIESVIDVVSKANLELIKKWREDNQMNAAILELFQPEVDSLKAALEQERQEKEQERQEKEQERRKTTKNLLKNGVSIEIILNSVPLTREEIEKIQAELDSEH